MSSRDDGRRGGGRRDHGIEPSSRSGRRSRSRSPDSSRESWRNVKIKDEPLSDVEGSGGHRQRRRDDKSYLDDKRRSDRDNRERSSSRFSSSSSRDRDSRDYDKRRVKEEPRSRSRSPPPRSEFVRPADRGGSDSRYRGGDRDRDRDRSGRERTDGGQRRNEGSRDDRPRDVKREKDWDNFFNPNSEMSREGGALRERANAEREARLAEEAKVKVGGDDNEEDKDKNLEKEKPNFGLSGKLTEETNTYRGVVIKYSEPPEARKPIRTRWRLYPFKDGEALDVMYIHRQSAYLLGRERKVADIPIDHPSCSKQHAALQYRLVPYERPDGSKGRRVRPYIIDLESSNGTYVNGTRIEPSRYVELFEKDVLKFGFSSREYVLLHEHSKDDDPDIDDEFGAERSPSPD